MLPVSFYSLLQKVVIRRLTIIIVPNQRPGRQESTIPEQRNTDIKHRSHRFRSLAACKEVQVQLPHYKIEYPSGLWSNASEAIQWHTPTYVCIFLQSLGRPKRDGPSDWKPVVGKSSRTLNTVSNPVRPVILILCLSLAHDPRTLLDIRSY